MAEYTIDEVARVAGTNVRNVRAYQQRELLPPPRRRGRAGVYTEVHLTRLRLIGQLLDRGYSLGNIAEMLRTFEEGRDLAQLLGLEAALTSPWSAELTTYITPAQLAELYPDTTVETVGHALALGLFTMEGGRIRVHSPRLLYAGAEIAKAGIPTAMILRHLAELRVDVERIAQRFVNLIVDQLFDVYGADRLPPAEALPRLADDIRRMRPQAQTVVEVELARALEKIIGDTLSVRLARIASSRQPRPPAKAPARKAPSPKKPSRKKPTRKKPTRKRPAS